MRAAVGINPRICGGQPCVRGTRVPVAVVLRALAHSRPPVVAGEYGLTAGQVIACLEYAARLCEEAVAP